MNQADLRRWAGPIGLHGIVLLARAIFTDFVDVKLDFQAANHAVPRVCKLGEGFSEHAARIERHCGGVGKPRLALKPCGLF